MWASARLPPMGLFALLVSLSASAICSASALDNAASSTAAKSTSAAGFAFGRVGLYYRSDAPAGQAVLDFAWDRAPEHLRNQLQDHGLDVALITSPTEQELTVSDTAAGGGLHAYVVPPANGPAFYAAAEDMAAVASFVRDGGLVVLTEGNQGDEATKAFLQQALGYEGKWLTCRELGSNRDSPLGTLERSERYTSQFLPYAPASIWVPELEDAPTVVAHSWCIHEDPGFTSWPLYTSQTERFKLVTQAFGKAGSPGAVVWLGYNWREGPQRNWGELLAAIVQEFALRSINPLSKEGEMAGVDAQDQGEESAMYDSLDMVFESLEGPSDSLLRRFMNENGLPANYPPHPSPNPPPRPPPANECEAFTDALMTLGRRALGASRVLYNGTGSGTYYYDLKASCPQDKGGYKDNDRYPACAANKGPNKKTLRQLGTNNAVAIDVSLIAKDKALYCGKKVIVYYNGMQVTAPDGGDFFVWDGCGACKQPPGGLDFSVSGLKQADANACALEKVKCITWKVVDEQVRQYVP